MLVVKIVHSYLQLYISPGLTQEQVQAEHLQDQCSLRCCCGHQRANSQMQYFLHPPVHIDLCDLDDNLETRIVSLVN